MLDGYAVAMPTIRDHAHRARVATHPPTRALDVPHSVVLFWQVDGIAGFWGVRSQNSTEDVVRFWLDCDAQWVDSRTRRYAASPASLPALDSAGRVNV